MLDLEEIYNKTEFATILTTGRTGSDYLQACLDNVPGIMTFSGHLHFYNFCQEINFSNSEAHNLEKTLDLFIKKYYHLFTEDKIENKKINLDIEKFKNNFIEVTEKKNLSRQKFLFAIYLAYHLTLNRNIENIKIMVHHSHHVIETKKFLNDFVNSKLLVTIRDPRANLKSGITNWIKYDESKHNQQHYFTYIKRIREDLEFAKKQSNKKFFLKLEEANNIKTKEKLCSFLGVEFNPIIMTATFANKIWVGDKLSRSNTSDGSYNKKAINNDWENFFTKKDKLILNLIYTNYKSFGYEINKVNLINIILIFFFIPLPFVFDKKFFTITHFIHKKISIREKIKNIYFYAKRVLYFYKLLFKFS
jgi:hypothetical protein